MKRKLVTIAVTIVTLTFTGIAAALTSSAMYELKTEIEINAPAERVWNILTDADQFSQWNPFIHELKGILSPGEKLEVVLGAPGQSKMTFKPEVLVFDQAKEFRWIGKLFVKGLFDGEHIFELQQRGEKTYLIHREEFTGILVPLFKGMLEKETKPGFELMNQALKERAEQQA